MYGHDIELLAFFKALVASQATQLKLLEQVAAKADHSFDGEIEMARSQLEQLETRFASLVEPGQERDLREV